MTSPSPPKCDAAFLYHQQKPSPRLLLLQQSEAAVVPSSTTSASALVLSSRSANRGCAAATGAQPLRPITPPVFAVPAVVKVDAAHAKFSKWQLEEAQRRRLGLSSLSNVNREQTEEELEEQARTERRKEMLSKLPFVPSTNLESMERHFASDVREHVDMSQRRVAVCKSGGGFATAAEALEHEGCFMEKLNGRSAPVRRPTSVSNPLLKFTQLTAATQSGALSPRRREQQQPQGSSAPMVSPALLLPSRPSTKQQHQVSRTSATLGRSTGTSLVSSPVVATTAAAASGGSGWFLTAVPPAASPLPSVEGGSAVTSPSSRMPTRRPTAGPPSRWSASSAPASASAGGSREPFRVPEPWTTILAPYEIQDVVAMAFQPNCPLDSRKYRPTIERDIVRYRELFHVISATDESFRDMISYRTQNVEERNTRTRELVKDVSRDPARGEDGEFQHLLFSRVLQMESRNFYVEGFQEMSRWAQDRRKVCSMKASAMDAQLGGMTSATWTPAAINASAPVPPPAVTNNVGRPDDGGGAQRTPSPPKSGAARSFEMMLSNMRNQITNTLKTGLLGERSRVQREFFDKFALTMTLQIQQHSGGGTSTSANLAGSTTGSGLAQHAQVALNELREIFYAGTCVTPTRIQAWVESIPMEALFQADTMSICCSLCSGLMVPLPYWLDVLRERMLFAASAKSIMPLPDDGADVKWVTQVRIANLGPRLIRWICGKEFQTLLESEHTPPSTREAVLAYMSKIPIPLILSALKPDLEAQQQLLATSGTGSGVALSARPSATAAAAAAEPASAATRIPTSVGSTILQLANGGNGEVVVSRTVSIVDASLSAGSFLRRSAEEYYASSFPSLGTFARHLLESQRVLALPSLSLATGAAGCATAEKKRQECTDS